MHVFNGTENCLYGSAKKPNSLFHPGQDRRDSQASMEDVNMGNFQSDIGFHIGGKRRGGRRFKKRKLFLNVRAFQVGLMGLQATQTVFFLDVAKKEER